MNGHASLLDVFNAAGRAATPFLQEGTARLRERNEFDFKVNMDNFEAGWKHQLQADPYNGDEESYKKRLDAFIDEKFNGEKGYTAANNSIHYQKLIQRARQAAGRMAEDTVRAEKRKWDVKQEAVDMDKDIERLKETHMFFGSEKARTLPEDPVETVKKISMRIEHAGDFIGYGPEERHKLTQAHTADYFQQYSREMTEDIDDVAEMLKMMTDIRGKFAGHELMTASMEEWHEAFVRESTARIHKKNENKIRAEDAVYRDLMKKDAELGGGTTYAKQANDRAKQYREGVQKDLRDGKYEEVINYADSFKDVIPGLFDGTSGRGSGSGSESGKEPRLNLSSLDYSLYKLIQGSVLGTSGTSYYELGVGEEESLAKTLIADVEALAKTGDAVHQENMRWIQQNGESAFITQVGINILAHPEKHLKRLMENNAPTARYLSDDVVSVIRAAAKNHKNFGKRGESLNEQQINHLESLLRDCAAEENEGISDEKYMQKINRELDLIVVDGTKKAGDTVKASRNAKIDNETSMARAMWNWQEDRDVVHTSFGGGDDDIRFRTGGYEKEAEAWIEKERTRLSKITGKNLSFVKYDREPGTQKDIYVKGVFMDGDGNWYRSVAESKDGGKNVSIRDERRDGALGEWKPYKGNAAPAPKQSASEAAKEQMMDEADARTRFVSNGKVPPGMDGDFWKTYDGQADYLDRWSKRPEEFPPPEGIKADEWKKMNPKDRLKKLYGIYGVEK
jgi:hypothetical protein